MLCSSGLIKTNSLSRQGGRGNKTGERLGRQGELFEVWHKLYDVCLSHLHVHVCVITECLCVCLVSHCVMSFVKFHTRAALPLRCCCCSGSASSAVPAASTSSTAAVFNAFLWHFKILLTCSGSAAVASASTSAAASALFALSRSLPKRDRITSSHWS